VALKLSNLPAPLMPLSREGLCTCSTKALVTCLCLYGTDLSSWKDTLMNLLDNWLQRPVRRQGTEIWVLEELGDDKLRRSPQRAHLEIPNIAGLTRRRGACTQKDSQNLFLCELINEVGVAAATRLLMALADSMSFLGS
jgi:hypothetical protein